MKGVWHDSRSMASARTFVLEAIVEDLIPEDKREQAIEIFQRAIAAGRRQAELSVHSGNTEPPPRKHGVQIMAWARWQRDSAAGRDIQPEHLNRFVVLSWVDDEAEVDGGRWNDGGCSAWFIERWWPMPSVVRHQEWNGENWELWRPQT